MFSPKTQKKYCVLKYSIDKFKTLLKSCSIATIEYIDNTLQSQYYETYFDNIGAKTIVIESNYIDKHYLEDYSEYYIKCFYKYQRECNRLHFFKTEFDKSEFELIFSNSKANKDKIKLLQENYLGFIVLKKLPQCIIGNTCLKTYEEHNSDRSFPVKRLYETSLFGIPLSVKSLAFQTQDTVVAACATSALWSIFQATGKLFQHRIPSPVEITRSASVSSFCDTRNFPNKGLPLYMVAEAMRYVGLEPYKIDINNDLILKASIYAYLRAKIPAFMMFGLLNINTKQSFSVAHAAAVAGYNLKNLNKNLNQSFNSELSLKSDNIDKIYVHDDQVGPFAKMAFKEMPIKEYVDKISYCLSTSWGRSEDKDNYLAIPVALSVPLYKLIRIPLEVILTQVSDFNHLLKHVSIQINNLELNSIEWDVYLINSKELKKEILSESDDTCINKLSFLTNQLPEYLWCAEISLGKERLLNIVFDATDIEQNLLLMDVIVYNNQFFEFLKKFSRLYYENDSRQSSNHLVRWFSSQTSYKY